MAQPTCSCTAFELVASWARSGGASAPVSRAPIDFWNDLMAVVVRSLNSPLIRPLKCPVKARSNWMPIRSGSGRFEAFGVPLGLPLGLALAPPFLASALPFLAASATWIVCAARSCAKVGQADHARLKANRLTHANRMQAPATA